MSGELVQTRWIELGDSDETRDGMRRGGIGGGGGFSILIRDGTGRM